MKVDLRQAIGSLHRVNASLAERIEEVIRNYLDQNAANRQEEIAPPPNDQPAAHQNNDDPPAQAHPPILINEVIICRYLTINKNHFILIIILTGCLSFQRGGT